MAKTMTVTIHEVSGIPRAGYFNRTDPYVNIGLGDKNHHTERAKYDGDTASFNETFAFEYNNETKLFVEIMDDNHTTSDTSLAKTSMQLTPNMLQFGSWSGNLLLMASEDIREDCPYPRIRFTITWQ